MDAVFSFPFKSAVGLELDEGAPRDDRRSGGEEGSASRRTWAGAPQGWALTPAALLVHPAGSRATVLVLDAQAPSEGPWALPAESTHTPPPQPARRAPGPNLPDALVGGACSRAGTRCTPHAPGDGCGPGLCWDPAGLGCGEPGTQHVQVCAACPAWALPTLPAVMVVMMTVLTSATP